MEGGARFPFYEIALCIIPKAQVFIYDIGFAGVKEQKMVTRMRS